MLNGLYRQHEALDRLVQPLSDNYAKLNPQIELLLSQGTNIVAETSRLASALSNNRQIGNWGEIQLRRVVELAGMTDYCDFEEQATVDGQRPDMVITMPDKRKIIIDAKTSTQAYMDAYANGDEDKQALTRHAHSVKAQVDELSKRKYGESSAEFLNFVVMFVPGDAFLSAALRADPTLIEYAAGKGVVLATPSTLLAMLLAVAEGWQRRRMEENAEKVKEAGEALYKHVLNFIRHYKATGDALEKAVKSYNLSISAYDRGVAVQGQKLGQLITGADSELSEVQSVEELVKESRKV